MKTENKALLLSALVLPGLGQIALRRYKTGIAIIILVVISLYRMMSIAMQQANAMVNQLMAQGQTLDMQAIADAAGQSAASGANSAYNFYMWTIIICWIVSIVDVWLRGRKQGQV